MRNACARAHPIANRTSSWAATEALLPSSKSTPAFKYLNDLGTCKRSFEAELRAVSGDVAQAEVEHRELDHSLNQSPRAQSLAPFRGSSAPSSSSPSSKAST